MEQWAVGFASLRIHKKYPFRKMDLLSKLSRLTTSQSNIYLLFHLLYDISKPTLLEPKSNYDPIHEVFIPLFLVSCSDHSSHNFNETYF